MSADNFHIDFDRLLVRYLSGELNPEEQERFNKELSKDPGKRELLDRSRKIWDGAVPDQDFDLDAEWALLQKKLPGFKEDSPGGSSVRATRSGRATRSLRLYSYRIAAVLVLGLVLTFSWVYVSRMAGTVRVVAKELPVEVILEDGSQVTVNRNSVLRYSKSFEEEERKVYLSGEAWFEVARDSSRPFVIDAGAALVEVLGTRFNVNAYRENPTVEITVESGLVAMSRKADQKKQIVMKAGTGGSFNKALNELKLVSSSDPNSIAWKTRELFFDGTMLSEVCTHINKVYGVEIIIMNEELASCPITVTFRNQTLESVLKVLESTLDLELIRDGEKIRLNGEGCVD